MASPAAPLTLTLCAIVRDEALLLQDCLQSVVGFVDDIVLLDTGSTDDTIAIAQAFQSILPIQIHSFTWCDDFSAARNAALQWVGGDWVLVLDADERMVPESFAAIRSLMADPNAIAINLLRQEVGAAQSPYSLVSRLFRRHPAIRFTRPYHAMIDDAVEDLCRREPHWKILTLDRLAMLHLGYQRDRIQSRGKAEKARRTMEGFYAKNPNDPYVCSKLGALYCDLGDWERGQTLLQHGLQQPNIDAATQYELQYHLASIYAQQGEIQAADDTYQSAIAQSIPDRLKLGAIINWGALRQTHGDLETAQWIYQEAIAIDSTCAIAYYNLGLTYRALGQFSAAIEAYQTAQQLQPENPEIYQNLGVAWMQQGETAKSLAAFRRSIELYQQLEDADSRSKAEHLSQSLNEMGFQL